jgi:hypothetical protein
VKKSFSENKIKIQWTRITKIPPNLPFLKGGTPLFGKEGPGEIFNSVVAL